MFDLEYNRALRQCNNLAEHPARLCAPNPILQPDAFSLVSTELLYASLQFIHNFSQLKKKKKSTSAGEASCTKEQIMNCVTCFTNLF